MDENLTEIRLPEIISDDVFVVDMMYARADNMMRTPVYQQVGLGNRCFVQPDMMDCLMKLRPMLQKRHLKLKICDAYRPVEAFYLMKHRQRKKINKTHHSPCNFFPPLFNKKGVYYFTL